MKNSLKLIVFVFFTVISLLGTGCKKKKTKDSAPLETSTVSDIDNNVYSTVKIGDQWWMTENLRVTKYNDGTPINEILTTANDTIWSKATLGSQCLVDPRYGRLYNWMAVKDSKKIAPTGWHIPSDAEWKTLEQSIGMSATDADKLAWRGKDLAGKLAPLNTIGWPMTTAFFGSNDFLFSALPGGCRVFDGTVNSSVSMAFWWTSTENSDKAYYRYIDYQNTKIFRQYTYKTYGFSIRCVKD